MEQKADREPDVFLTEESELLSTGGAGLRASGERVGRIWCCGGLSGRMGCSRSTTQGTLYGYTVGFRIPVSSRKVISSKRERGGEDEVIW